VRALAGRLPDPALSPARDALKNAILTVPEHISAEARKALAPIMSKYFA
jgi:hypothetical protein